MKSTNAKQSKARESKEDALHYIQTLVEVARESFLILDADLRVVSANPTFYKNFQVSSKETENKFVYDLGNGQWNIPALRSLLEQILPKKKEVSEYEVVHVFETIGEKTMLLNAKQVDSVQLIILAIEDITKLTKLESELAAYAKGLENKVTERTQELADKLEELESLNKSMVGRELKMMELKKEIEGLKELIINGNGKKKNGKNGQNRRNGKKGKKGKKKNS